MAFERLIELEDKREVILEQLQEMYQEAECDTTVEDQCYELEAALEEIEEQIEYLRYATREEEE